MSEKNIKVSVIIPVYNTEKYLEECLESVTAQTLKEIEIICVDDGSDDASPQIIQKYAEKDKRIKLLKQSHKYAGAARNYGMSAAAGECIFFIDSDDMIQNNTLEVLYNGLVTNNCDIALTTSLEIIDNEVWHKAHGVCHSKIISPLNSGEKLISDYCNIFCNRLCKTEFLKKYKIKFSELRNAEDLEFSFLSAALANKIYVTNEVSYIYRKHSESTNVNRKIYDEFIGFQNAQEVLKKNGVYELVEQDFKNRLCFSTFQHLDSMNTIVKKFKIFNYVKSDKFKIFNLADFPEEKFYDKCLFEKFHDLLRYNFIWFYFIQFLKKIKKIAKILYYLRSL